MLRGARGKGAAVTGTVATLALGLMLAAGPGAMAADSDYAPIDRPGPTLRPSKTDKVASLSCTDNVVNATREPVLLLPATGVDSAQNFSWNYERAFRAQNIPYCTSDAPRELNSNLGDIQKRAEYVVYAIRKMYRMAGRRIATVGHSQGGMVMRWPFRFWPDTRRMVKDVVGFAGSNHGTDSARFTCSEECAPAAWQQRSDAKFIEALNSRQETFSAVGAYTEIYTHTDVVVVPNSNDQGSSSVHGPGRIENVAIQDVCPADLQEHLAIGTNDNTAWALFKDAITHDGPANPDRIPAGVCNNPLMPGINPASFAADNAFAAAALANNFATYPGVEEEPKLRCYVYKEGC
jgi:hypothetical protein